MNNNIDISALSNGDYKTKKTVGYKNKILRRRLKIILIRKKYETLETLIHLMT